MVVFPGIVTSRVKALLGLGPGDSNAATGAVEVASGFFDFSHRQSFDVQVARNRCFPRLGGFRANGPGTILRMWPNMQWFSEDPGLSQHSERVWRPKFLSMFP